MKKPTDTFAVRLRTALDKSGRSVAEIATAAGLARQTIYQLLRGGATDPPWSTVCKLADALKIKTDSFR